MRPLSKRELNLLNQIAKSRSVKDAAYFIRTSQDPNVKDEKMDENAAYQMLQRIRKRQKDARQIINTLLQYRRRTPLLEQVLTPKIKMKPEEGLEDEDGFKVEIPKDTILSEEIMGEKKV
jgi:hypothetical protein